MEGGQATSIIPLDPKAAFAEKVKVKFFTSLSFSTVLLCFGRSDNRCQAYEIEMQINIDDRF